MLIVDNTITLSKNDEWTHNGVISIGGQHNDLKLKGRTDKQWGNQHYLRLLCCPSMLITPLFVHSSFLLKVIVLSTNVDYPIVCPFVLFT
jgi:hypothetical protein